MGIKEAKAKCPQLVLVSGEDLTHYRDMSYKITGVKISTNLLLIHELKITLY